MPSGASLPARELREVSMGVKADDTLAVDFEELLAYLRSKTRVFMDVDGHE